MATTLSAVLLFALLFAAYAGVYFLAALSLTQAGEDLPRFWWLDALLREAAGQLIRGFMRLPTYSHRDAPWATLCLNPQRATADAVLRKCEAHRNFLRAHAWAYPPSQRKVLGMLQERALRRVELRDAERATHARHARQLQWRSARQLQGNESNVATVKTA